MKLRRIHVVIILDNPNHDFHKENILCPPKHGFLPCKIYIIAVLSHTAQLMFKIRQINTETITLYKRDRLTSFRQYSQLLLLEPLQNPPSNQMRYLFC